VDTIEETEAFICDQCKEPVSADALWCPKCGTLFIDTLRCFLHPDALAHGRCVTCGQHVCPQCATRQMSRYFCEHDAAPEQEPENKSTPAPTPDWEAELYRKHFNRDGVPNRLFEPENDIRRISDGQDTNGIKLIVPFGEKRNALRTLAERGVERVVVLFECERCSAISHAGEPVCPNCGR
jgi:RNA polymerase subunit RPABC4/transcription elongation factor Spt4